MDPESLYVQLCNLVAEFPVLGGGGQITPEINLWLGRAAYLVGETGDTIDLAGFKVATNGLNSVLRESNAQHISAVVFRALARAEANAPTTARGAFIAVGAAFDAFQALGKLLSSAKQDVLIVDPYMDSKILMDFAASAPEGVKLRLLADAHSTKQISLEPAANRWIQQFGDSRPLEARLSAPRSLHDRLIMIDGASVWTLTQSLKDFATRSPASVLSVPADIAQMKAAFYGDVWANATRIV